MSEYITKEQVIEWFRPYGHTDEGVPYYVLVTDIREMKSADVAPVRHGRWMKAKHKKDYWGFDSDGDFGCWSNYPVLCSSCKYDATENSTGETNYCPNCGAKMEQEDL